MKRFDLLHGAGFQSGPLGKTINWNNLCMCIHLAIQIRFLSTITAREREEEVKAPAEDYLISKGCKDCRK